MKLRDANLQLSEKNSLKHPSSCVLPSFSQNASRLLLLERLRKCASTISFRKHKWKVVLLVIYLLITIHPSQLSSCSIWHFTFSLSTPLYQIGILRFFKDVLFLAIIQGLQEHPSNCCVF